MNTIRVVQIGLGPLGQKISQFVAQRKNIEIVGAVDASPDIAGKDLGELCGLKRMNIIIQGSIGPCLKHVKPHAAVLTTVSSLKEITPQIEEVVSFGVPVVSTCEELSYPWDSNIDLSTRIDEAARKYNVAVLGTGVNPGFLMDSLPIFLTAVCQDVQRIRVSRIQNAGFRRIPFQKKIGAGLTLEEFEEKRKAGTLRHVGLAESLHMIAKGLGWKLTRTEDILSPVVADEEITTETMTIPPGHAAGVEQIGKGLINGEEKITLLFRASVGEPDPQDSIEIQGTPNISSSIEGGLNGDVATCAITVNAVKHIVNAEAGLRTMLDMPSLSFFL